MTKEQLKNILIENKCIASGDWDNENPFVGIDFDTLYDIIAQEFELLSSWFKHIEQMAKDRKTANGNIMNMQECLNEISVLAKDSREYIQKAMEEL